eukprot:TRINITY_DN19876_c0_g1_i1.p1 TRINITY_DN19876_c0_g1~~TRINITY_DN19876_c0_g1_i1.p1  ORF type:complete len:778 (+),score=152.02 TRINITY_DN19876_c0_g1_i1:68-2401(+)
MTNSTGRTNGFHWPLHPLQVSSWVVFSLDVLVFFTVGIPTLQPVGFRVCVALWFSASVLTLGVAAFIAMKCDPADKCIYEKPAEEELEAAVARPTEGPEKMYCRHCDANVLPSSRHCRSCKKCVQVFDHHCIWLNTCVGEHNYNAFAVCIGDVLALTGCILLCCLILFIQYFATREDFEAAWREAHGSAPKEVALVFILLLICLNLPLCLLDAQLCCLHIFLCWNNMTTYDYIMYKLGKMAEADRRAKSEDGSKKKTFRTLPRFMDWIVFRPRKKSKEGEGSNQQPSQEVPALTGPANESGVRSAGLSDSASGSLEGAAPASQSGVRSIGLSDSADSGLEALQEVAPEAERNDDAGTWKVKFDSARRWSIVQLEDLQTRSTIFVGATRAWSGTKLEATRAWSSTKLEATSVWSMSKYEASREWSSTQLEVARESWKRRTSNRVSPMAADEVADSGGLWSGDEEPRPQELTPSPARSPANVMQSPPGSPLADTFSPPSRETSRRSLLEKQETEPVEDEQQLAASAETVSTPVREVAVAACSTPASPVATTVVGSPEQRGELLVMESPATVCASSAVSVSVCNAELEGLPEAPASPAKAASLGGVGAPSPEPEGSVTTQLKRRLPPPPPPPQHLPRTGVGASSSVGGVVVGGGTCSGGGLGDGSVNAAVGSSSLAGAAPPPGDPLARGTDEVVQHDVECEAPRRALRFIRRAQAPGTPIATSIGLGRPWEVPELRAPSSPVVGLGGARAVVVGHSADVDAADASATGVSEPEAEPADPA